jgi:copper(I)-binding protein
MKFRLTAALALAALSGLASPVLAHAGHHASAHKTITISQAWARETAPAQVNGGGFLTITNNGQADRLVSASSPVAPTVQLHTMSMDGGVMRMRELPDGIPVPAQSVVELKPGGLHVMFIGLKAPLKPGQKVALTLRFEKAGVVKVAMPVRAIADMGKAMSGGHDQH